MQEFKGTKGKWFYEKSQGIVGNEKNSPVCQMWDKHENDLDGFEANANLIAAAPELLEVALKLKEISTKIWGEDKENHPRIMDRFEKVIEKALGKNF